MSEQLHDGETPDLDGLEGECLAGIDRMIVGQIACLRRDLGMKDNPYCQRDLSIYKPTHEVLIDGLTREGKIDCLRFVLGLPVQNFDTETISTLAVIRGACIDNEKLEDYLYARLALAVSPDLNVEVQSVVDRVYRNLEIEAARASRSRSEAFASIGDRTLRLQARAAILKALAEGRAFNPFTFKYRY